VLGNKSNACRISTVKQEYQEDLEVIVEINFKDDFEEVFSAKITSKKEYNSWFYVDFGDKVFVPKGAKFLVQVQSSNVYQLIPYTHIIDNIYRAKKCGEFSWFCFYFYEQNNSNASTIKSLEKDGNCFFCLKSLSLIPVDEQGRFDNTD